jgi:hypothetical protein
MKLDRRSWLILLGGPLALAAQAWFESPMEMLVIGAPFYVALLLYITMQRFDWEQPQARAGKGVQAVFALFGVGALVFIVYVVWSRITDTGLVGWLDAVQARHGGHYSEKLSVMMPFIYLVDVLGALFLSFQLLRRRAPTSGARTATPRAAAPAPARPSPVQTRSVRDGRVLGLVFGGIFLAVWVIGLVAYEVISWRHQRELGATYTNVDLSARNGTDAVPEFAVLRGQPHARGYVTLGLQNETAKTSYLPIAARGAAPGEPVHWVIKFDESVIGSLPQALHTHARGEALAPVVREGLAQIGVVVAADAVLVDNVPTRDGQVIDRTASDREMFLGVAGLASLLIVLLWLMVGAMGWWQRRKETIASAGKAQRAQARG